MGRAFTRTGRGPRGAVPAAESRRNAQTWVAGAARIGTLVRRFFVSCWRLAAARHAPYEDPSSFRRFGCGAKASHTSGPASSGRPVSDDPQRRPAKHRRPAGVRRGDQLPAGTSKGATNSPSPPAITRVVPIRGHVKRTVLRGRVNLRSVVAGTARMACHAGRMIGRGRSRW